MQGSAAQGQSHGGSQGGPPEIPPIPWFGYYDFVPCVNGSQTCEYVTALYIGHAQGMSWVAVLWMTFIVIFVLWAIVRHVGQPKDSSPAPAPSRARRLSSTLVRTRRTLGAFFRRGLLQDAVRPIFGRASRLQVLVLALLSAYLICWSFIGIVYREWVAPAPGNPGVTQKYTGLAPWADRVGVLAYALTPFLILLGSRESLLSLMSGIPYQSFNFLHRWVGYIIFAQGILHTVGWVVVEVGGFGDQSSSRGEWISQTYMIWGCVAIGVLTLMIGLSTPWGIRMTGYEFFRKSHYALGILYFGSCVAHWHQLEIFMAPSLILWVVDRVTRLIRSGLIHFQRLPSGRMGFRSAQAAITTFPDAEHGDVIRLDFESHQKAWPVGKHFFLCFTELSIWQSHPFTPLNVPICQDGVVRHSYIMRVHKGATLKLARLAYEKMGRTDGSSVETPVVVTGPYGEAFMKGVTVDTNVVCVAGGTGITAMMSVLLKLAQSTPSPDRKIELIWAMRDSRNTRWIQEELDALRRVQREMNMTIRLYATRDIDNTPGVPSLAESGNSKIQPDAISLTEIGSSSSRAPAPSIPYGDDVEPLVHHAGCGASALDRRPDLGRLLSDFLASTVRGPTTVFTSGPADMTSDLRTIVAAHNSAGRVWRGESRYAVRLVCDDRLER